jgi:uracil phosphoribosyltransferase
MSIVQPAEANSREGRKVVVVNHPLAAAKLSVLRAKTTSSAEFRRNLNEVSIILALEAAETWPTEELKTETPLATCSGVRLSQKITLVPILRAGLGMAEGILQMLPQASVGHLGIYRDEKTLRPVSYYRRLPENISETRVLLLDPMLATGFSACEAVAILKQHGVTSMQFLCLVSCNTGIKQLHQDHPEVEITTAAIDPELNDFGYIVPGLGDAGDRYFGTE